MGSFLGFVYGLVMMRSIDEGLNNRELGDAWMYCPETRRFQCEIQISSWASSRMSASLLCLG